MKQNLRCLRCLSLTSLRFNPVAGILLDETLSGLPRNPLFRCFNPVAGILLDETKTFSLRIDELKVVSIPLPGFC